MSDDTRGRGGRHFNGRKRRYRDDDDYDRRPQRRRYEEPTIVRLRKQLRSLAESPTRRPEDEIAGLGQTIAENYFDEELQNEVYATLLQIVVEQPIKVPFAAAVVLVANTHKPEAVQEILTRAGAVAQKYIDAGSWREFKLVLRFLALLQSLFDGDGVFPILDDLFSRAVDLQTASSEDALGLELVKIILLTIPYAYVSPATDVAGLALALLEKTDIIASTPNASEALVDPFSGDADEKARESTSVIGLLQKQLQTEASRDWPLACIPRPWTLPPKEDGSDAFASATKHAFPAIVVPNPISQKSKPMTPELYVSVYADQEFETVPPTTDVTASLVRDALVDTINILDFNRLATARFLADVDCYFASGTFVKRATPFDKLKDFADTGSGSGSSSTWKPEDVAVDAVFSQMFQLPAPPHKLVYYHSVLTEFCRIAPAAVAPSLGRAIRFAYRAIGDLDRELAHRFLDWFSHHLSNFGFTWKWTEWTDDVPLPDIHPKKAFILGALDKEIRLSFARRIKGTLPDAYKELIRTEKENDTPDFKYDLDETPFSEEAQAIVKAIRKRESDDVLQGHMNAIRQLAEERGDADPLIPATDAFVTSLCFVGAKSLSHVLSCIDRCKDRLVDVGGQSDAARKQIVTSVLAYWHDHAGVGVNIVDKLLNYTLLTPTSVIEWALLDHVDGGAALARSHVYEMVSMTVSKVANRVRQVLGSRLEPGLPSEQAQILDDTLQTERAAQSRLFAVIEHALVVFAEGDNSGKDDVMDASHANNNNDNHDDDNNDNDGTSRSSPDKALIRDWAARWLRVFRRRCAVEEAFYNNELAAAAAEGLLDGGGNGNVDGGGGGGVDDDAAQMEDVDAGRMEGVDEGMEGGDVGGGVAGDEI